MGNTIRPTMTVREAITCALEATSYEGCIKKAISIGGDSDTVAAIAGSIGEAFWGPRRHC